MLLVCASATLHAALIRVNNNAGYAAAYTSLAAATAAANAGDTIYVEPSPALYDDGLAAIEITKKLVIVGNGYYLNYNTGLQVRNNDSAVWPNILFKSGSQGSVITGINVYNVIAVLTDDITIKRCGAQHCYVGTNPSNGQQVNTTQTQILENLIWGNSALNSANAVNNTALIIKNNIFSNQNNTSVSFSAGDQGIFENNTVHAAVNFGDGVFNVVNNLVQYGLYNYLNTSTSHNTCACTADFPTGSNNTTGATWASLFLGGNGDQFYRTNPAGAAANTGFYGNGDDRGAFTDAPGRSTYRLGGIPEFPAIYKLLGGGTVSGPTIQVTVSARSNN